MTITDHDELLTTREAAEWLGVSPNWLTTGRTNNYGLQYARPAPRAVRYRVCLIALLDERTNRCTSEYGGRAREAAR